MVSEKTQFGVAEHEVKEPRKKEGAQRWQTLNKNGEKCTDRRNEA